MREKAGAPKEGGPKLLERGAAWTKAAPTNEAGKGWDLNKFRRENQQNMLLDQMGYERKASRCLFGFCPEKLMRWENRGKPDLEVGRLDIKSVWDTLN